MELNEDLILEILNALEASEWPITVTQIPAHTAEEINYHTRKCIEAEFVKPGVGKDASGHVGAIMELTWKGHEFLNKNRKDTARADFYREYLGKDKEEGGAIDSGEGMFGEKFRAYISDLAGASRKAGGCLLKIADISDRMAEVSRRGPQGQEEMMAVVAAFISSSDDLVPLFQDALRKIEAMDKHLDSAQEHPT